MRILFVAPWIPSDLRPRSLSLLSVLAAEHEVHFLAPARTQTDRRLAEELVGCASVTLVGDRRWRSVVRVGLALLQGKSLQTAYANSRALRRALENTLSGLEPDVVHFNVFRTAHLVPLARGTTSVIDLDEYRSEYYEQLARSHHRRIWRALGKYEAKRMAKVEKRLESSGCTILLSAPRLQEMPQNVFAVPSVSLLPATVPSQVALAGQTVLFVGRLTYEANQDAIRWFVNECWEGVVAAVPGARLLVVGDRPPRDIAKYAGNAISVTGSGPIACCLLPAGTRRNRAGSPGDRRADEVDRGPRRSASQSCVRQSLPSSRAFDTAKRFSLRQIRRSGSRPWWRFSVTPVRRHRWVRTAAGGWMRITRGRHSGPASRRPTPRL